MQDKSMFFFAISFPKKIKISIFNIPSFLLYRVPIKMKLIAFLIRVLAINDITIVFTLNFLVILFIVIVPLKSSLLI